MDNESADDNVGVPCHRFQCPAPRGLDFYPPLIRGTKLNSRSKSYAPIGSSVSSRGTSGGEPSIGFSTETAPGEGEIGPLTCCSIVRSWSLGSVSSRWNMGTLLVKRSRSRGWYLRLTLRSSRASKSKQGSLPRWSLRNSLTVISVSSGHSGGTEPQPFAKITPSSWRGRRGTLPVSQWLRNLGGKEGNP